MGTLLLTPQILPIFAARPKARHRGYTGYSDAEDAQFLIRTYDQTTKLYASKIRELGGEIQKDLTAIESSLNAMEM